MASRARCREQRGCRVAAARTPSPWGSLANRRRPCLCAASTGRGLRGTRNALAARENHTAKNKEGCRVCDVPSNGHLACVPYLDGLSESGKRGVPACVGTGVCPLFCWRPAIISIHFWIVDYRVWYRSREQYTHLYAEIVVTISGVVIQNQGNSV